jgi:hypothetical protein
MRHCRGLNFEETPNYEYLRSLFTGLMQDMNYQDDGVYEWTLARQRIEQQNLKDIEEAERIKQLKLSKS